MPGNNFPAFLFNNFFSHFSPKKFEHFFPFSVLNVNKEKNNEKAI